MNAVAGWAQQQINTHSFKKDSHIQRQWSLFAGEDTEFKVQRDVNNVNWVEDLHLSLTGKGFGYPVRYATNLLLNPCESQKMSKLTCAIT